MQNERLAQQINLLTREIPWSAWLLQRLKDEGWRPTHCSDLQRERYFWLRVQTRDDAQQQFQLAPEILCMLVKGHVQQQFLADARAQVNQSAGRLDSGVVVVVDPKPDLRGRLQSMYVPGCVVGWPQDDRRPLLEAIAGELPTADPFDVRTPVRGPDRIGREGVVNGLIRDLQAHAAIGVFGLRKMGKTTVVNAAIEKLDPEQASVMQPSEGHQFNHDWLLARVDAQSYLDTGMDGLCRSLTRMIGSRCRVSGPEQKTSPLAELRWMVERSMNYVRRVCLVVDEFDWIVSPNTAFSSEALKLLGMLRGMAQTWEDRFRVVFIGRRPELLSGARLFGSPNPALNFFRPCWVGPMTRDESDELLTRLGKRAVLAVGPASFAEAWRLAAGHPLMTRLYGSSLLRLARGQGAEKSSRVATDRFAVEAGKYLLRGDDARAHFDEVKQLLREVCPEAFEVLGELTRSPEHWETLRDSQPRATQELARFGLVEPDSGRVPEILAAFLRPLPKRSVSAA
jgi:hypothetical protein